VPAMTSSAERAERERAFFDNICISTTPNISSREWWESPGGRSRFERRISFILNELKSYGPHPRLLLIGCGNGQWFERLSPHAELRAIDISPKMVESLQSRLSDDDKRRVEIGNAHSMEFEDSSFDMVVANSTLQFNGSQFTHLIRQERVALPVCPHVVNRRCLTIHLNYVT